MSIDIRTFARDCLHFLSKIRRGRVPRPFDPSLFVSETNDLLQFDYIELGPSSDGAKYVVMVRDDHLDCNWFSRSRTFYVENPDVAIIDWYASFEVPKSLLFHGSKDFHNETVRMEAKGRRVPHHFTAPTFPWNNGAVERPGKELLRVFRSVKQEQNMSFPECLDLLPLVQSALNDAPSPKRGNISLITALLEREHSPLLRTFFRSSVTKRVTVEYIELEEALDINSLNIRVPELRQRSGMHSKSTVTGIEEMPVRELCRIFRKGTTFSCPERSFRMCNSLSVGVARAGLLDSKTTSSLS